MSVHHTVSYYKIPIPYLVKFYNYKRKEIALPTRRTALFVSFRKNLLEIFVVMETIFHNFLENF